MHPRPVLVGRRQEAAAVATALRSPGRVLVLVGDAGMGKSRLLDEAAADLRAEVPVLFGRCLPLSVDLPLLPIVDALRSLLTQNPSDFDSALSRCPAFVRSELTRLLPELGEAPAGDPQRQPQFEAVRRVLAETAAALVIDDLHWSDNATLDLLEYLVARPDGPAIVLAVRPARDISDRVRQWLTRITRLPTVDQLQLGPLANGEVRAMLESLGWTGDPASAAGIAARSGGIPYYVEQLAAVDADAPLPEGLQMLVRGRLAGLPARALDLLRVLSVAGRPMTDEEIEAACDGPAGDALRELDARGVVGAAPTAGAGIRRAPVHALLAEAVRDELTSGEMRSLHGRIAAAFAAQPDVDADDVARHLARAGDTADEAAWRIRAAEQARRRAAPREAYGHLARAISVDPEVGVQIYLECCDLARHAGDTGAAWDLAERTLTRFDAKSSEPVRMRLWNEVGHHRVLRDRSGLDALRRAVEIGRALPPTAEFGYVLYDYERHLRGHGDFGRARAVGAELVNVAAASGDPELSALADVESACLALLDEDDAEASRAIDRAERVSASAIGPGLNTAAMITDLLLATGRLSDVVDYGRQVLAQREAAGLANASVTGAIRADVAAALLEQGRPDEAEPLLSPNGHRSPAPDAAASADLRSALDVASGNTEQALDYWRAKPPLPPYPLLLLESVPHWLTALVEGGCPADAVRHGMDALNVLLKCDQSRFAGRIIALVRRALADLVDEEKSATDARARSVLLDELVAAAPADPFAARSYPVTGAAFGLTDAAEKSRVEGRSDPQRWNAAASAWTELARPWRTAYCRWRGAQAALATRASRPRAVADLQQAWTQATGHVPLRAAIAELARVARVDLREPAIPSTASTELLTSREFAVLRLLADGMTNAEIGRQLYISPKTTSVHVTHIMRKLGVRSRVEAATRAQRAGLLG